MAVNQALRNEGKLRKEGYMKSKKIVIMVLFFTLLVLLTGVAFAVVRVDCDRCLASGKEKCPDCDGVGTIPVPHARPGSPGSRQDCPRCIGGKITCRKCDGLTYLEIPDPPNPNEWTFNFNSR